MNAPIKRLNWLRCGNREGLARAAPRKGKTIVSQTRALA
jgi:hypothetical protein